MPPPPPNFIDIIYYIDGIEIGKADWVLYYSAHSSHYEQVSFSSERAKRKPECGEKEE